MGSPPSPDGSNSIVGGVVGGAIAGLVVGVVITMVCMTLVFVKCRSKKEFTIQEQEGIRNTAYDGGEVCNKYVLYCSVC